MTKKYSNEAPTVTGSILKIIGLYLLFFICTVGTKAILIFFEDSGLIIHGIPIAIYAVAGVVSFIIILKIFIRWIQS